MNYYGKQYNPTSELKHWKYIKRERVNGKWKYTYATDNRGLDDILYDKLGYDERRDAIYARDWRQHVKDGITEIERAISEETDPKAKQNLQNFIDYNLSPTFKDAHKDAVQKIREYQDTPLYKIENFANKVKNGEGIVNKLLNKILKKVVEYDYDHLDPEATRKHGRVKYD